MKAAKSLSVKTLSGESYCSGTRIFQSLHWVVLAGVCVMPLDVHCASPGKTLKRLTNDWVETVQTVAFSPDRKTLAIGSSAPSHEPGNFPGDKPLPEGTIELWDLDSGKLMTTLRQSARSKSGDTANKVGAITFSPDGKWLIGSDFTGYTLWEVATLKQKFKWPSGMIEPLSPGWSPDGKWIALPTMVDPNAAAFQGYPIGVALVDAETGKSKMFYPVERGFPRAARFSPNGKLMATAGHDCTVRVFDTKALTNVFNDETQYTMFAVAFSPDGHTLVAGSCGAGVMLIYEVNFDDGKVIINKKASSRGAALQVHSIDFTPDQERALSNSTNGILLWDATTWLTYKTLTDSHGYLSTDGNQIALVRNSAPNIEIWSLADLEKTLATLQIDGR